MENKGGRVVVDGGELYFMKGRLRRGKITPKAFFLYYSEEIRIPLT